MNKIKQFEDLDIWKNAVELALVIYKACDHGKLKNDFGMRDQVKRASASISNNIAEGFEYNNNRQFIRFLYIAKGSAGELRNQLFILKETGYITKDFYDEMYKKCMDLSKQISNFIKYLTEFENNKKATKN